MWTRRQDPPGVKGRFAILWYLWVSRAMEVGNRSGMSELGDEAESASLSTHTRPGSGHRPSATKTSLRGLERKPRAEQPCASQGRRDSQEGRKEAVS